MTGANSKATLSSNGDVWKEPPRSSTFLLTLWGSPSTLCRRESDGSPRVLDSGILQSSQGFSEKVQAIGPVTSHFLYSHLLTPSFLLPFLLYFLPPFFPLPPLFFILFSYWVSVAQVGLEFTV